MTAPVSSSRGPDLDGPFPALAVSFFAMRAEKEVIQKNAMISVIDIEHKKTMRRLAHSGLWRNCERKEGIALRALRICL